jgi:segregation and condensation protein B
MSRMRQKRKARGRATREAADALAAAAGDGLEVVEEGEGDEAGEGDEHEVDAAAEAAMAAAEDAPVEPEPDQFDAAAEPVEGEADADAEEIEDDPALPVADLDPGKLKRLIEALLFATDKPLSILRLRQLTRIKDAARIQAAVDELATDYTDRGVALQEVAGGYLFRTHHDYSTWVQQLIQGRPVRLSRAQLETLAIVAYRQPITRPEIDDIRGVDSGATLKILLDRTLIRILGKKEEPGRPLLYGTTKEFLDFFSLKDLRELPTLREYSELTEESRQVVSKKLGEDVPAEAPSPIETQAPVEEPASSEASDLA